MTDRPKTKNKTVLTLVLLMLCVAAASFFAGRNAGRSELGKEKELLQSLNRSSIENMDAGDGSLYVIGHRSPDTDTVCSAIVYARLLRSLGYNAEAVISEPPNRETAYILQEAGEDIPPVLEDASGEYIFLIDHSEYAQAIGGMEDAHIAGILDHHGVGSVSTGQQIVYEARPIGAAATIVWIDYLNYGVELDQSSAYLLLSAILSDTSNLTATAVTEADRLAVSALAETAGVADVSDLYKRLHAESLSYEGMSSEEILFSDYKEYEASGVTFGIGLVNAIDEDTAKQLAGRMKEVISDASSKKDVDLLYACVGIRENGEKIDRIIPGNELSRQVIEDAFPNYDEYDGTSYVFRKGLGRKTKFVPGLTDYLAAHPHE